MIDVPSADPDDARRRKLLNLIMMSMAGIAILTMIAGALSLALGPESASGIGFVFPASIAALIGAVIFYFTNRYRSGIAASILFLLFLTMSLALADSPSELANGRSLFLLAIPIIVVSVLLGAVASFAFYVLASVELVLFAPISGEPIKPVAIVSSKSATYLPVRGTSLIGGTLNPSYCYNTDMSCHPGRSPRNHPLRTAAGRATRG